MRAPLGTLEVSDISASGSGMILRPSEARELDAARLVFELDGDEAFATRLELVRSYRREGGLYVGTRFRDLDADALGHLSQFLIREFVVQNQRYSRLAGAGPALRHRDPEQIVRLLRFYAIAQGRPLRVYADEQPLSLRLQVESIDEGALVASAVAGELVALVAGREYGFVVGGIGAACHFRAPVVASARASVTIATPAELHQSGFRDSMRPQLPSPSDVVVEFRHPRLSGRTLVKSIVDVSGRGFAFALAPERDLIFPGDQLASARLRFHGHELPIRAMVRSIAPHHDAALICGLEILEFAHAADGHAWHDFVFHCAHPRLELARESGADRAWQVLASSQYVGLWTESYHRRYLAEQFLDSWSETSDRVGHLMLLSNRHGTVGTVAGSLLYPRTWMVHHLGVDRRERRSRRYFVGLARELYSGIMFMVQYLADLDFFVIFVEEQKRWTTLLYGDFVAQYPCSDQFVYDEFRAFKCDVGAAEVDDDDGESRFEVGRATGAQLAALSAHLVSTTTALEVEAMAYDRDEIDLGRFSVDCAGHDYERTRAVFVASAGGVAHAVLIAETGGEGVNVFGLLNRAWFVSLAAGEPIDDDARRLLLRAAIRHYRAAGKRQFVLLDDAASAAVDRAELGLVHISKGIRWLARRELVPAWLSYVDDLLGMYAAMEG